jgi:outer membrane protein
MTLAVLGLAIAVAAADSAPRPISIGEAVALAQRNGVQMLEALGQERTSAAAVRSAYAAFLPSVSISAGANRQLPAQGGRTRVDNTGQIITLTSEPWSSNVGLQSSVELFDGGRRFFDLRQANARQSAARVNALSEQFSTTLAVKQQFYNVLAARESEHAADAQLDQARQQLRASIVQLRSKTVTRSDSLRSEIQVRSAQLAVMDASNALEAANVSLTRAVGLPYLVTAADDASLEPPTLALDDATLRARAENSPAVRQARDALTAARAARQGAWTNYLPSVSASYSRGGSGSGFTVSPFSDELVYSGSLRLSLSLPIFNQLQREEQITQARVAEDNAEAALRDARLAAAEGLTQSLGAFRSAEFHVASEVATVEAAVEDLRVQQQRYVAGGSTILDVLASQTQLDQARRDLIRARYDQRVAKAQLEALLGQEL